MDLDEVAGELYGLPPEQFVAARTAREKEAKAAGDKSLAAQIHGLAKPNQVAWLANQLVRQHATEIEPLLSLGAELREAADGLTPEQLREFSGQQRQLVGALVQQAKRLAHEEGKKVSDDTAQALQATLHAALADAEAAGRLMAGRLVEGMQHVGFGPGLNGPTAAKRAPQPPAEESGRKAKPETAVKDKRAREIERAEREVRQAEALAKEAVEMRDDTEAELDKTARKRADVEEKMARLQEKLERAEADHARLTRDQRRLRSAFERSEKTAADAVRRLQKAQKELARLSEE